MISLQKVTKIYKCAKDPIVALKDVSFSVQPGEFVSIMGRSGAGKTTIFKLLTLEERPTEGAITFKDTDINQISSGDIPHYRRQIGVIFQDYKLLPSKTVAENVAYILEVMGADNREIEGSVCKALDLVGLAKKYSSFPQELSGGERQRAAIARALVHKPQIILADEPTGNLDPYHTRDLINLLKRINEMGTTVILASHNKDVINAFGKRMITLEEGRVIADRKEGKYIL